MSEKVVGDDLGLDKVTVRLVDYNPKWATLYRQEEQKICRVLWHLIEDIQHFGSTSVPELKAKPIIDMIIGLKNLADWERCRLPLEKIGYEYVWWADVPGHYVFSKGDKWTHLIHIVEYGGKSWLENLKFRDVLRQDANLRREYQRVKEEAARLFPNDRPKYNAAKGPFISGVKSAVTGHIEIVE